MKGICGSEKTQRPRVIFCYFDRKKVFIARHHTAHVADNCVWCYLSYNLLLYEKIFFLQIERQPMLGHRVSARMSLSELSKLRERGFLDIFRYLYFRQACPMARCIKMPLFAPFLLSRVSFFCGKRALTCIQTSKGESTLCSIVVLPPPLEAKEKSIIQQLLFPSLPSAEGERKGFFWCMEARAMDVWGNEREE